MRLNDQAPAGNDAEADGETPRKRILFLGFFPDWGHAQPLMRLAWAAQAHGFSVSYILPEMCKKLADQVSPDGLTISVPKPPNTRRLFDRISRKSYFFSAFASLHHINLFFIPSIRASVVESLSEVKAVTDKMDFDLIVSDSHIFSDLYNLIADFYGVPLVILDPSSTMAQAFRPYDRLVAVEPVTEAHKRIVETAGQVYGRAHKLALYACNASRAAGLRKIKADYSREIARTFPAKPARLPSRTVFSGLAWIEKQILGTSMAREDIVVLPPSPPFYRPLGREMEEWLARDSTPVIYVSFGSMISLTAAEYRRIAAALADLPFRVVWSISSISQAECDQIPSDAGKLWVTPFVEQSALLRHRSVRCFVTQAGASSALEALFGGTPMLAVPFLFDQPYIASLIGRLGVGERLAKPEIFGPALCAAIVRTAGNEAYRATAERIAEMLWLDATRTGAIDWIERLARDPHRPG
jgi:UDP:flavonoid glycosyltransferase YjiC (YdhE family)